MRHRVSEFQKVLNRAKTEVATTERKTVTYVAISFIVRLS
jgi:actin related protein 2/3 complex subunit 2